VAPSTTLYRLARGGVIRPATKLVWPTGVEGLQNVPAQGPAIIAPNHISFLDSVVLIGVLPRQISFVGKAEYMDSWRTRYLFPAMGMIPIDRSGGRKSMVALDQVVEILDRGELFGIFPEGTRSRDGLLHRGRTGVARLALQTGAPVIPVGISGTDQIQPPDARCPRPFRPCRVRFGRRIDAARYLERIDSIPVYRELTDEVMYEISQLSGQTYVDRYASRPEPDEATPALAAVAS